MHHTPKKSFGQHFLKSQKVVRAIIEAAELSPGDTVVEVGPGTGVLTRALVDTGAHVIAIEADRDLIPALKEEFGDSIELIEGDALKFDPKTLTTPNPSFGAHHPQPLLQKEGCRESRTRKRAIPLLLSARGGSAFGGKEGLGVVEGRYKLVANLPYNVGTEILERFLTSKHPPSRSVVMVQKEVGERMLAKPGDMSLLSLAVQLYTDPKRVIRVPPGAFVPPPKVDSLVVRLDQNPKCADQEAVMAIAKKGFRARRKQLHRNLADAGIMASEKTKEWLRSRGSSESARAQELSPKDWIQLCYTVKEYGSSITPHS